MRDTRPFRHFVVFRGLRSKALAFVDRVAIRHFRRFRQNPLFSVGGQDPVWQRPRSSAPDKVFFISSEEKKPGASTCHERFGVYHQSFCFLKGKRRQTTYTPTSLPGVCGGPLGTSLVYRDSGFLKQGKA